MLSRHTARSLRGCGTEQSDDCTDGTVVWSEHIWLWSPWWRQCREWQGERRDGGRVSGESLSCLVKLMREKVSHLSSRLSSFKTQTHTHTHTHTNTHTQPNVHKLMQGVCKSRHVVSPMEITPHFIILTKINSNYWAIAAHKQINTMLTFNERNVNKGKLKTFVYVVCSISEFHSITNVSQSKRS